MSIERASASPLGAAKPRDRWLGTPDLPGYRAGCIVARLTEFPEVAPGNLYLHLLLLDPDNRLQDDHSGPCFALSRAAPIDARSRFVRVLGELARHAANEDAELGGIAQALSFVRRHGVEPGPLELAVHWIDALASEAAVVASLSEMLTISVGREAALDEVSMAISRLVGQSRISTLDAPPAGELEDLLVRLVRIVGKVQVRRHLQSVTDLPLLPTAAILGL